MASAQNAEIPADGAVVIDDGQYKWAADRGQLVAALERLGWAEQGSSGIWQEPEAGEGDDDSIAAYAALCDLVDSVAGEGSTEPMTDALLETSGRFTFRPDLGEGCWTLEG